jgi:hypothetical protein
MTIILPAICMFFGGIVLVGTLALLFNEKIFLDAQGNRISKIELPGHIKFESYNPVLVLFVLGCVMVLYPLFNGRPKIGTVEIKGTVSPHKVSRIYAVAYDTEADALGNVVLSIPDSSSTYEVFAVPRLQTKPFKWEDVTLAEHKERPIQLGKLPADILDPDTSEDPKPVHLEPSAVADKYK